jgi:hypothetical protein
LERKTTAPTWTAERGSKAAESGVRVVGIQHLLSEH